MYVWIIQRRCSGENQFGLFGIYSNKKKALSVVSYYAQGFDSDEWTEIGEISTMIKVWNKNDPVNWDTYFVDRIEVL